MRVEKRLIKILIIVSIITIILLMPKSYGAVASKPATVTDGSNVLVSKSVSDFYSLCQNMKNNGESLYGSSVKPHLATNKDWGAVSYLSNSSYGTNTEGKNDGKQITMNGVNYYSTTGNASGVMNWGKNPYKINKLSTYSSGLAKGYVDGSANNTNKILLKTAAKNNSKYVDVIDLENFTNENTLGMALAETKDLPFVKTKTAEPGYWADSCGYAVMVRMGLFDFTIGHSYSVSSGEPFDSLTFRPVVWN